MLLCSRLKDAWMSSSSLTSLSPLDGRYAGKLDALRATVFRIWPDPPSPAGRDRMAQGARCRAAFYRDSGVFAGNAEPSWMRWLPTFGPREAAEVKEIEAVTNHDVKALEYWIKKRWRTTRR
jgi:adenylosuccinate lyase